jgi:potassium-transporting ATPase KdpC subunit
MKYLRPAIVLTVFFVLVTGLGFPVVVWAIGQTVFPREAHGSLLRDPSGIVIGSELIGQNFVKPEHFHPRPSAAKAGYDAANSSGTNLGPTSDKLVHGTKDDTTTKDVDETYPGVLTLAEAYRQENGLKADAVIPADAVTRSASGLDPHISPANAALQVARVAKARQLTLEHVREIVRRHTSGRTFGIFGEPRVNVLMLNRELDGLK